MRRLMLAALLLPSAPSLAADLSSPAGLWRTVDDKTGRERSDVRIYELDGKFYGRVERILDPKEAVQKCVKCTDDRRDQPVLGMVIMRGLQRDGEQWDGGRIVDPETGDTYRCKMHLVEGGQKLELRGYVMMPMLGRTQTWKRDPEP